jgi:hypothetical protein
MPLMLSSRLSIRIKRARRKLAVANTTRYVFVKGLSAATVKMSRSPATAYSKVTISGTSSEKILYENLSNQCPCAHAQPVMRQPAETFCNANVQTAPASVPGFPCCL